MKPRILLILLLVSSFSFAQTWNQVGATQFTNFATDGAMSFHPTTGEPYIIYNDLLDGKKPYVKKFDGTNWVTVGTGAIINFEAKMINLAFNPANNELNVVFKNVNTGKVDIYKFDGTNWLAITTSLTNSEFFIDTTRLQIYYDSSNAINIIGNWMEFAGNPRMTKFYLDSPSNWVNQNSIFVLANTAYATSTDEYVLVSSSSGVVSQFDYVGNGDYGNSSYLNNGLQELTSIEGGDYWAATGTNSGFENVVVSYRNYPNFPQPSNTETNLDYILDLEKDNALNTLYLMYSDSSDMLQVQSYNASSGINNGVWNTISTPNLNAGTSNFFSQIIFNSVENSLYLMYLDGGKLSTKKYTPIQPIQKYYVNANVSGGDGSGDSWANAMPELSTAVNLAGSTTTDIWVAAGTYKPGTSRNDSFGFSIDNLQIYGGFNGTETTVAERSISANPTILSGDLNDDDQGVSITASYKSDNSYHIVNLNANNVNIDGFTIEKGHAYGTSLEYGGGVLISDTSQNPTFKNCIFRENVGLTGGAVRAYFNTNSTITFEHCVFDNNLSRYGSGAYILTNNNRTVTANVFNCLFNINISRDNGASQKGYTGSSMWIRANGTNSDVTTNVTNCTFTNNVDDGTETSSDRGTLALSRRTDGNSTHNATINNSIFYANIGASVGTTKAINSGHTSMPDLTFVNNSIDEDNFSNLTYLTNTSNADPLFTDPFNEDYTLQTGSPAIDSGDNTKIPAGVTTDLLGNQRIFNTTVDMGVYEYGSTLDIQDFETKKDFVIYPNPTSNTLNIKMPQELFKAEIFNVQGQKVLESTNKRIEVSNLAAGMYLLQMEDIAGNRNTKRFIKN